jgi:choline dehydrogenase-like flavoprotein
MKKFSENDDNPVVIIGSGAGGGTLGAELAARGADVVCLEAGGHLDWQSDFVNDEWEMFARTAWLDKRTTSGDWRIARDFPNLPAWICKTVGGTTVHWAGASLRLQKHEFKARSAYGDVAGANLADWPIGLADLAPYYDRAEDKLGVTRTHGIPGLPPSNNFKVFEAGAKKLGYRDVHTGRMAINSQTRDGRAACRQLGFCFQGCRMGAKWSTLYAEIPEAIATDHYELRPDSYAVQITHDARGRADGVVYFDGEGKERRQRARAVCVACNSIESPRLLLHSASAKFPDGLANGSGQVGKNYMRHTTGSVYAIFDNPVHMFRGTTMAGICTDESGHRPARGFAGGYEMETLSLGIPFMAAFLNPGGWGADFAALMEGFDYMAGMWIVGEDMPREQNRITLHAEEKDARGVPLPNVHFDDHENDTAMRNHAYGRGAAIYEAIGARRVVETPPYPSTHNLGTNRMSQNPRDGVVDAHGRAHEIPNLFVSDGSQFTTGGAENPTLTIVALAIRQAEYIADRLARGDL